MGTRLLSLLLALWCGLQATPIGSTPLGGPWPDGPVAAHAVFAAHKEQAVPELSTLLMLVFGLGLIGLAGGLKRIVRK